MVGCIEVADLATPQQGRNELPHRQAMCTIKNPFYFSLEIPLGTDIIHKSSCIVLYSFERSLKLFPSG